MFEKMCSAGCPLHFRLVLRALGPADGGSAGRRNWWHVLFSVMNARVDADNCTALLRTNAPYVFPNWYSSPLRFVLLILSTCLSSVDCVCGYRAKVYMHEKHAAPRTQELMLRRAR